MRHIRKAMAMLLALTTILSMLALGAGAAFTDEDQIKTAEAVNMLTTLNIIKGADDGSFQPERTITRAEIAKMIYVLRNGGRDDGATMFVGAISGTAQKPALSDVKGHWAEGYINWAYSLDIIAGRGNGTFDPNGTVTGLEAAKMLLVALGYTDTELAGLTGSSWNIGTANLAASKGLFSEYDLPFASGSQRQYAAQMVYNALFANTVNLQSGSFIETNQTLGERYMSLSILEGTLVATGENTLGEVKSAGLKKLVIEDASGKQTALTYQNDMSEFLGQAVRVAAGKDNAVYGVFASQKNSVLETSVDRVTRKSSGKLSIDGSTVSYSSGALVYKNGETKKFDEFFGSEQVNSGASIRFISNDGDDRFDLAIVDGGTGGKVTGAYQDRITTDIKDFSTLSLSDDEISVYEGVKKDDYIVLKRSAYDGSVQVTKMDSITGKVTSTRSGEVEINGQWYAMSADKASGASLPSIDQTVTVYLLDGYIYQLGSGSTSSYSMGYVVAAASSSDLDGNYSVKLLSSDGTQKTVNSKTKVAAGDLVSYTVTKDVYTMTPVSSSNLAGAEKFSKGSGGYEKAGGRLAGAYLDSDSVIFVSYGSGKSRVMTGAELLKLNADFGDSYQMLTVREGGFDHVRSAVLVSGSEIPGIVGETNLGMLTDSPALVSRGGKRYAEYKVWNGTEEISVSVESSTAQGSKGDFVRFDSLKDGEADDISILSATAGAVTAYNKNSGDLKLDGDAKLYRVTDNTAVLYIVSADSTGKSAGSIELAGMDGVKYINNVKYRAASKASDGAYELEMLVVDVNNEMK